MLPFLASTTLCHLASSLISIVCHLLYRSTSLINHQQTLPNPPSLPGHSPTLPTHPQAYPNKISRSWPPTALLEQGIVVVQIFLELANTNCPEGILIQTSLEYLQLEIGLSAPILQADFSLWGHLATPCWLKSVLAFLHASHLSLHMSQAYIPLLQ